MGAAARKCFPDQSMHYNENLTLALLHPLLRRPESTTNFPYHVNSSEVTEEKNGEVKKTLYVMMMRESLFSFLRQCVLSP